MEEQITLFMELAGAINKKCLLRKGRFPQGTNEIYSDETGNMIKIYYANDYNTWALYANGFEFYHYSSIFTIDFSKIVHGTLENNLINTNNVLRTLLDRFENFGKPKRRQLNFIK